MSQRRVPIAIEGARDHPTALAYSVVEAIYIDLRGDQRGEAAHAFEIVNEHRYLLIHIEFVVRLLGEFFQLSAAIYQLGDENGLGVVVLGG